jgi:hypothetical protein
LFKELKARFEKMAVHVSLEELRRDLRTLDYVPYAPIRNQLRRLLPSVNHRRRLAGLELVPAQALELRRIPVRPFE